MQAVVGVILCALVSLGATQSLPAQQKDPCKTQTGVVGDLTYCDRYWECVGDQALLYDCPNGLVFVGRNRGIAEGCDYPWRGAYCQSRIHLGKDKERANPPVSTEHCNWLYGIFGHETSCTRYWTCWNGTSTEQFCIGGLLYNEETHACDWPQNVQGCQKHPLCREDANANVPLGQSCERYWSCQGGYPRLQRCPATLVFDKATRRCTSPPTIDCEAPPPPPPTKETESSFRQGGGPPRRNNPNRRRGSQSQQQGQPRQQQEQPRQQQGERRQQQHQQQLQQQSLPRPNLVEQQPREEEFLPREQQQQRPAPRPRRPSISLADLPQGAIPSGAIPISFGGNSPPRRPQGNNFRPAPIEGAIPLN